MSTNRLLNLLSRPALLCLLTLGAFAYLGAVLFLVQPRPEKAKAESQARVQQVEAITSLGAASSDDAPQPQPDDLDDLQLPHAITVLDVHLGPGDAYAVVGLVPRGGLLQIVGRDPTSAWLAITFTADSTLHGWVPLSGVAGVDDVSSLSVATITLPPSR